MTDVAGRGVQSIEVGGRVLSVLAVARRPLMLRDIAVGADLTPAQAHAYLLSFRKIGLVEQTTPSGLYQLGPFALQLGLARLRSVNALRLAGDAVVELANELGLMVTVTVWGSFGATIVQVQEGTDQIHANVRAGAVYSLIGTATGRVFAAFLPPSVVAAHLQAERRDRARRKRVGEMADERAHTDAVATVRRLGYATTEGSPIPGVNALSAPVFDHTRQIQLAVTIIGPADIVEVGPQGPLAARLLAFTHDLSAQLGYSAAEPPAAPEPAQAVQGEVRKPCARHSA